MANTGKEDLRLIRTKEAIWKAFEEITHFINSSDSRIISGASFALLRLTM